MLGLTLLATAAVCALVGVRDDEPAAATPGDERASHTALFSPRRTPFVFVDAVARSRLNTTLGQLVAPYNACVAVDGEAPSDRDVVRLGADQPLIPASTLKLLTAAAALRALGPDHRFVTQARIDDDGNLALIGVGDPVLSTPEYESRLRANPRTATDPVTPLASLADAVVASGVRNVSAILADDSRHDDVRFLPDWKPSYVADVGPLGALTVDDGSAAGARVADPALNAGEQLRLLLVARGVQVGGVARGVAEPDAREAGSVTSPPLSDLIAGMLRSSDNLTAEMLTREIAIARGDEGSTPAGVAATTAVLQELGIPTAGLELHDGSGLATANRATCDAILSALELASDPRFAAIDRGLAVAASSGTLVNRLRGDALAGILRAKTGQIDGVAGLAGIVDDDEHLRFAFLVNSEFTTTQGQALQNEVARLVRAYPEAPPAPEVVPAP